MSSPDQRRPTEYKPTPAARRALRSVGDNEITAVRIVLADGRKASLPPSLATVVHTAVREATGGHEVALVLRDDEVSTAKATARPAPQPHRPHGRHTDRGRRRVLIGVRCGGRVRRRERPLPDLA